MEIAMEGGYMEDTIQRRQFLAVTLGLSARAVGAVGQGSSSAAANGYIDAHVHVWPPQPQGRARPVSFTPEELFANAKPVGVTRIVLIQISFYKTDNSYMLGAMAKYRGVFSGVAVVDSTSGKVADEMRKLKQQGVRGFRITPGGKPQTWLDAPGMEAMWRCGAEERLAMCPLVDPSAFLSIDRMCARHPDTPVVIDHLGRIGADGLIRDGDVRQLCDLARHRQLHVKVSAFYALGKKQYPYLDLAPMIRRLVDAYGVERLMWASDSPFQVQNGNTYAGSIELVRDRLEFLSASDREWLLRKSAERVFFEGV